MANNGNSNFNPKLKNTAKLTWQTKPKEEPEPKDLEFQNSEIIYPNVELKHGKLTHFLEDAIESKDIEQQPNRLIWGDNLLVMQALLSQGYEGKIDLIYIDPPFNTGENFNFGTRVVLPKTQEKLDKELTMIERLAYTDTWERGIDSFLDMIYPRLKLIKRLLSSRGVLVIHIDYNASHYIKVISDEIFNGKFVNEIVVKRTKKNFVERNLIKSLNIGNDVLLIYAKTDDYFLRPIFKTVKREASWHDFSAPNWAGTRPNLNYELFGKRAPPGNCWRWRKEKAEEAIKDGRLRPNPRTGKPEYLIPARDKEILTTLWDDLTAYNFNFDYPTEKSRKLLERIFDLFPDDKLTFADFFIGSGTSIAVAEQRGCQWIGCDLSKTSIHVTRNRILNLAQELASEKENGTNVKDVAPFILQNLGNYQRHLIYTKGLNIKKANSLIFKLYKSKQRDDLIDIGIKC